VYLQVVRKAVCAICEGEWTLEAAEKPDARCRHCGSGDWDLGPESKSSILIRNGISRLRKSINPGATSKKRVDHGKKQYRQFKPKPIEKESVEGEN
jgi:hypothetical protein